MIISIEGNIGSGKTTLFRLIRKRIEGYIGRGKSVVFVDEPVTEWETIKDDKNQSMLDLLYADPKTHAFAFQMMAFITRFHNFSECRKRNPDAILVTERCLQTDAQVFAKMLHESGDIIDVHYQIYQKWASELASQFTPDIIVYVRAEPPVSLSRVKKRARKSEEGITIDYLQMCHRKHEQWLLDPKLKSKQIIFDANIEFVGDKEHRVDDLLKTLNIL